MKPPRGFGEIIYGCPRPPCYAPQSAVTEIPKFTGITRIGKMQLAVYACPDCKKLTMFEI